jgi:hypothetical protein
VADLLTEVLGTYAQPFQALADELASQHPAAWFSVKSYPVGSATAFQGHSLAVECYWQGRGPEEPDNVALEVSLCHLNAAPRVNADVCWGHGRMEAEFAPDALSSDEWPETTPKVLERLRERMPELVEALRRAVVRGWPVE